MIHQNGILTFQRPTGIPENYLVKITEKGAGMEYVHPTNKNLSVRVMPGNPYSPNPAQQKPYVIYKENGQVLNKFGKAIDGKSPEAHIPLDEFIFPINR